MKNRIISLTLLLLLFLNAKGQSTAENVVRSFGDNMLSWTQTGSLRFHENLIELSNGKTKVRVYDELSHYLFSKYNNYSGANELKSYLNCIEKEMNDGITIRYSNFRQVPNDELSSYSFDANIEFIACNVAVTAESFSQSYEDLFYIREGKISKIDKYTIVKDVKTGKQKIYVDYSDVWIDEDVESWGLTYNYGQHFPLGGSVLYAPKGWCMLFSVDFGFNQDNDKYITDKVEMTDIMNYKRTKTVLDPKWFITITPHIYFKHFAVGCGFGWLYMEGTQETASYSYTVSSDGSSSGSGGGESLSVTHEENKFMIRPTVKGFIPLDDDDVWSIVVSAGYDWVFGYKEKNGFNAGLGIKVNLDW